MGTLTLKFHILTVPLKVLNIPPPQQNLVTLTVSLLGDVILEGDRPHFIIYMPIITKFSMLLPRTLRHTSRKL